MKDQHFLIAKRPVHKMLGGLWELPGGKVKQNETEREAVIREIIRLQNITRSHNSHYEA